MASYNPDPLTPGPFESEDGQDARNAARKQDEALQVDKARLLDELRKAQPSWRVDGHGIRGEAASNPPAAAFPEGSTGGIEKGEGSHPYNRLEPDRAPFPAFSPDTVAPVDAPTSSVDNYYDFESFPANSATGLALLNDANTAPPDFGTADDPRFWVLILDGLVFGPNDDGNLPDGMGADNFVIEVAADGDEVWLVITQDDSTEDVTSVSIDSGTATPSDTDDGTTSTIYVTICTVSIDDHNQMGVTNNLCGDYVLASGALSVDGYDSAGDPVTFDGINDLQFSPAFEISQPSMATGTANIETALSVEDEDTGQALNVSDLQFTTNGDEFIDLTVVPEVDPDNGATSAIITVSSNANLIQLQNDVNTLLDFMNSVQDC